MVVYVNIIINVSEKNYETISGEYFPLNWGMELHKKYKTYELHPYDENNVFCFGRGVLPIIGGNRLIFSFKSPLWEGFHFSAMGGAGYQFKDTGLKNVGIIGKCEKPSLLVINGEYKENNSIEIDYIDMEDYVKNYTNIYDLNNYILDKFKDKNYRALIVGPSSINSNMGAVLSQTVRNGKFVEGSEDWAARGGIGSALYKAHNILGIVYYGDKNNPLNNEEKELKSKLKSIVEEYYKMPLTKVIMEGTKKYRFDKEINTGGTFGCNYVSLKDKTPMFNWKMIYMSKEERTELHNKLLTYFVGKFNEESTNPKKWTNCGEPCPVLCKKYRLDGLKVDYEPYSANGPQIGIFDIHATDKVVHRIDATGYDAIEMGELLSWVFELLDIGLLKPEEVGINKPKFSPSDFKTEEDILNNSNYNSSQAVELINIIAFEKNEIGKILALGKRKASQIFNDKFKDRLKEGEKFEDYAVYIPFGASGEMGPTLYWAIGNFMPYLIQGKYLTHYKYGVFFEPEKLSQLSVGRTLEEATIENLGICRFHRVWINPVIKDLVNEITDIDLEENTRNLIKDIYEYNKKICSNPHKIESNRVKDIIALGAEEFGDEKWSKLFKEDRDKYIDEYVKRAMSEYSKLLDIDWNMQV